MSRHATAHEKHLQHIDAQNELALQRRHEGRIRRREHIRLVQPLIQQPEHHYRTPVIGRYDPHTIVDHMLAPGSRDDTGFSDGVV